MFLKSRFVQTLAALVCVFTVNGMALAAESESAVMKSPATDGAYVLRLQGMTNNVKIKLLDGSRKTIDDGVVIRQSYVKDGKVVIPASGLYTTSRCSNWWSFNDHTFTIAGKLYHFITDEYQQDVVKNVTMKPGDVVFGNKEKTRGWELEAIDAAPFGIEGGHMAYFWLVKTTGNYYGNPFIVVGGANVKPSASDGSLFKSGSGLKEGTTSCMEQPDTRPYLVGNAISTNSRSVIYMDSLGPNEAKIKEFVTVSTTKALISPNAPVMGLYGKGDTFKIGKATVEVTDISADTATVKITSEKGSVSKTLKADKESLKLFPNSRPVCKAMYVQSADGKELVNINPRSEGGAFTNGKVALMAHSDVITVTNGGTWEADSRFITRPEICAECSFIHEIVLENKEPIVLDAKNSKYVGPEGYFSIVIDKMNGDTVEAWHVENAKARTDNLAGRAKGKHIDLVLGAACRSTGHFFNRVYPQLYKEALGVK
ncbi:hypothetical protein [uncultured Mailhella sp.]|uniref:hypothetical protein n=1 Tax=uncultured Mailhella sp. TaxID=1981031 RepID=UPI0026148B59|nr:hypothetical protein [uncultured Mailhella sp.]